MATPSRDRQASPAHSEGTQTRHLPVWTQTRHLPVWTQTRHLPVWTCPDMEGAQELLSALSKSYRFLSKRVPFPCPPTTFGPTPGNLLPPGPPNIPHRNHRLTDRLTHQLRPPTPLQRRSFLRYRTTQPAIPVWGSNPHPASPAELKAIIQIQPTVAPAQNPADRDTNAPATEPPKYLKATLLNTWSLKKHASEIRDMITTNNLDLLAITETWLTEASGPTLEEAVPPNYAIQLVNRQDTRGGGVAIIHRSCLKFFPGKLEQCSGCESLLLKLNLSPNSCLNLVLLYRPPNKMPQFIPEFIQSISPLIKPNTSTILLGDFNFGRGDPKDKTAATLERYLRDLDFTIINSLPTHEKGRTLDWIVTNHCTTNNLTHSDCIWSDHKALTFNIELPAPPSITVNEPQIIQIRNLKKLSIPILTEALAKVMSSTKDSDHPDDLVNNFYTTLNCTLETYAPLKTKKLRLSKKAKKWFTPDLKNLLASKRKAEQSWLYSKSPADKLEWHNLARQYKQLLTNTKKEYLQTRIDEAENSSKELFTVMEELLNPLKEPPSLNHTEEDCVKVQTFFRNKVQSARNKISNNYTPMDVDPESPLHNPQSNTPDAQETFAFTPITLATTMNILKKMKPCPDKGDLFPSKVILKHQDLFAPFLMRLINASFTHKHVPDKLKVVNVSPIPKKAGTDESDPANLRPITLVLFLLKLLDKVATAQFHEYLKQSNLLHHQQSGFRSGFSTETALLDLQINIRNLMENNKAGLLVLLDLSAAYDLLDHEILLKRLHTDFNCSPDACTWIQSFLSNRLSKVTWGNAESPTETLIYGVPQGACLSPALFNTYIQPLFKDLEKLGVVFTNYADDTQLLLELSGDYHKDATQLEEIYSSIKSWMDRNWMCLNGTKTELLIVATKDKRTKLSSEYENFNIEGTTIKVATQVKTLGVMLDTCLNMTAHTNYIFKNSHFHLRRLRAIRPLLSKSNSATLARATILPRLDYCNVLLTNTSQANIHKLQLIQNEAARIAGNIAKRDHISPYRKELHWLPIPDRIKFKTLCITHKCRYNTAPTYLSSKIRPYNQTRTLRSSNAGLLHCPRAFKKCGNGSSFTVTGPSDWNKLPISLRMEQSLPAFKKQLKTFLFN